VAVSFIGGGNQRTTPIFYLKNKDFEKWILSPDLSNFETVYWEKNCDGCV
jgi:hypothetical protein